MNIKRIIRTGFCSGLIFFAAFGRTWAAPPYEKEIEILKTKVKNREDIFQMIGKPAKIKPDPKKVYKEVLIYRHWRIGANQRPTVSGGMISDCISVTGSGYKEIADRITAPLCVAAGVPLAIVDTIGGWVLPGESERLSVYLDGQLKPVYYEARGRNYFDRGYLDPEAVTLRELMTKDPGEQDRILKQLITQQKASAGAAQQSAVKAQHDIRQVKEVFLTPASNDQPPSQAGASKPSPAS